MSKFQIHGLVLIKDKADHHVTVVYYRVNAEPSPEKQTALKGAKWRRKSKNNPMYTENTKHLWRPRIVVVSVHFTH